ncbi:MAG: tRNA lysidine(34) synthetase TilS [Lachnospiraceae bacterium]|jgi:tRNA(Ile)-lysidine synthase|nr:tRNA lysidine(34) synthetase TilS [Lachnospiraceae bacterium]
MKQVTTYIEQQHMIAQGDRVLVGVSGGADSVCLLHILWQYRMQKKFELAVLTVEHGIRGEDSLRDMEFVINLCEELEVPCYVRRVDVPGFAQKSGMSEEEAARKLRYDALYECADEIGADKIAVAHHANDLMETMLFFLCRGTGITGLSPMYPVSGKLIRPLLHVTREEIEAYLSEKQLQYCTDATNADVTYSRNHIRHRVIPLLTQVNPGAVRHFCQTAQHVAEAEEVLVKETERAFVCHTQEEESGILVLDSICTEPVYLQKQVILQAIAQMAGGRKDVTGVHVSAVWELMGKQVGSCADLPYCLKAKKDYRGVFLAKIEKHKACEKTVFEAALPENGCLSLPDGSVLSTRIFAKNTINSEIPDKTYTKWLDYDIIKSRIKIRTVSEGDFFLLDDAGHKKTIKKYFVDEKIPSRDREHKLVLAEDSHVYLILGHRLAHDARVTEATKRIMEIRIDKGERTNE